MSGDREAILGRVREALKVPAPRRHEAPARLPTVPTVTTPFREWLPQVGQSLDEQVALFGAMSAMLKTDFRVCDSIEAAGQAIAALGAEEGWTRFALQAGELTEQFGRFLPNVELVRIESGYDKSAMESCDAGLTGCETLVAQTGSICVTSLSSGGRALSALPPHHLVVASRSQVVADLPAAYERLAERYGENYPSFVGFITGPSRTGDIERILVLGAHGPKRVTVLLIP